MNDTLSTYFLSIVIFLTCPVQHRDKAIYIQLSQFFQSPLFFEIEEYNWLTRNGCIAVAHVTRDIVAKRDHTTAGNKGLTFLH